MRINLKRLERALGAAAQLVELDPVYWPIFERLEQEVETARRLEAARHLARA
jgi:hypothetical protein